MVQPQSLPLPDKIFWCACCLPSPCTPTHKGFHKGWRATEGRAPPFVGAAEGRLLCWWVCRGWAGSKHTKTLSPAKAIFGTGPMQLKSKMKYLRKIAKRAAIFTSTQNFTNVPGLRRALYDNLTSKTKGRCNHTYFPRRR